MGQWECRSGDPKEGVEEVRVVVVTLGSRGDVQPYVALGAGLKASGHEVVLATHAPFEPEVRSRGLDFFPMEGDPREEMGTEAARAALESGKNPFRFWRRFVESGRERGGRLMADCLRACEGTETVVFSGTGFLVAFHVAEALGVPFVPAYLQPVHRTRHMPDVLFPEAPAWLPPFHGSYNHLTHLLSEQLLWQLLRRATNEARREVLGLPPIPIAGPFGELGRSRRPYLYGFSPRVVPKPPDWGDHLRITGYWFLGSEEGWRPPPGLEDFFSSGEPPVCVGFGSMGVRSPEETTTLVLEALRLSGRRGVLLSGWGGIGNADLPDEVFKVEEAPHDWLFPRAAAVVHHGGAGTNGAGLAAGIPSVVVPFFGDQNFWAGRVRALGVGPEPIPRKKLSAERLAEAIRGATSDEARCVTAQRSSGRLSGPRTGWGGRPRRSTASCSLGSKGHLAGRGSFGASIGALSFSSGSGALVVACALTFGTSYMPVAALLALWSWRVFSERPATGFSAVLFSLAIGSIAGPAALGTVAGAFSLAAIQPGGDILVRCGPDGVQVGAQTGLRHGQPGYRRAGAVGSRCPPLKVRRRLC